MEPKTIIIIGATDGIGLATARILVPLGHNLVVHGRNPQKYEKIVRVIETILAEIAQ